MNHTFKILVILLATTLPAGCGTGNQEPELKGIKIGELAPKGPRVQPQFLRTTNIDCIIFELPAENIKSLDGLWQILNTDSVRYTDPDGFAANGLRVAVGEYFVLDKVKDMLKSVNAKKLFTTALLIPNGQSEMINIARLNHKTVISYVYRQGIIKSAEAGPGIMGLQVIARQIPGAETPANIQVVPVILASTEGLSPELAARVKATDIRFFSAGFNVMMKPGDFVVVAPVEYKPDDITAANRFFSRTEPKPAVRMMILVCTSVL